MDPTNSHLHAQQQWVNRYNQKPPKLQRLPIPVHIEEFYDYGGKAVCSNHVINFKIGKLSFNYNFSRDRARPVNG